MISEKQCVKLLPFSAYHVSALFLRSTFSLISFPLLMLPKREIRNLKAIFKSSIDIFRPF
ncbi:hypothetical protein GQX74_001202 [Glossina fuscipes]|nr:hypothetical protein GQX74_001202 [Glossina fuscipes]